LYEARGEFQLGVDSLRRGGRGALYAAFERLKAVLETEGLFDPQRKRQLPYMPRRVGIITSPRGAALHDVLITLARRQPGIEVIVYPTLVQGAAAAPAIAAMLAIAGFRAECDVLLLCRGGGSIEDLWAFNDEAVARAVAGCPIPVVTGIGHQTDFTIADFVADQRAATPTAAAELVAPSRAELLAGLAQCHGTLARSWQRAIDLRLQRLDHLTPRLRHPLARLALRQDQLRQLASRARAAARRQIENAQQRVNFAGTRLLMLRQPALALGEQITVLAGRFAQAVRAEGSLRRARLEHLAASLGHLHPNAVLQRGYSIVYAADGTLVRDAVAVHVGAPIALQFSRGSARATVTATAVQPAASSPDGSAPTRSGE
jgi:exodeoxyribonuclease VII large subunit